MGIGDKITWIVDTSFDAVSQSDTKLGFFVLQLIPDISIHWFGEERIVLGQVRTISWWRISRKCCSLFLADVLLVATSLLDPFRKLLDGGREARWRVGFSWHFQTKKYFKILSVNFTGNFSGIFGGIFDGILALILNLGYIYLSRFFSKLGSDLKATGRFYLFADISHHH